MTGHLIHIGYAKAGSTFLQRWFAHHPELLYREGGIAGLADIYELSRQSAAPPSGIRYRVSSSEGLATPHAFVGLQHVAHGEVQAHHLREAQEAACAALAALFPNAWILVVTRGF